VKYLGIDFGSRKVGLALGDGSVGVAMPWKMIPGGADLVARVREMVRAEGVEVLVVGVAVPQGAQRREHYERTLVFCEALAEETGLVVERVDEQFTSAAARQVRHEAALDTPEDALAAMIILQAFFDEGRGS
jgi:putative Holliday junction resolvase